MSNNYEELVKRISRASSDIKLMCGLANNAAWLVVLDAYDQVRQLPCYKFKVRKDFRLVLNAFRHYEHKLIYAETNRFFCLDDMGPETRKKYGNITNGEYYEFWTGIGARMYIKTKDAITSLQHKFMLALAAHGEDHAEEKAWAITAGHSLRIAVEVWERAMIDGSKNYDVKIGIMKMLFEGFNLQKVSDAWEKATNNICKLQQDDLTAHEHRNIEMGILWLTDAWADAENIFDSVNDASEDFMDIFRTKGEYKKLRRELLEQKHEVMDEWENSK